MADTPLRRDDPTRMTPVEFQLSRMVEQIGMEFDVKDPRVMAALKALVDARYLISDYVDNVEPKA